MSPVYEDRARCFADLGDGVEVEIRATEFVVRRGYVCIGLCVRESRDAVSDARAYLASLAQVSS